MDKLKNLSRGTKLILLAGPLLLVSLFFTWQNLRIDYGPAGIAEQPLDGWDGWGLLIALLVMGMVTLVVLTRMTELELPEHVAWNSVIFGLGIAIFLLTTMKNLTDADSTWASYGFVAVAGALAAGAYLNWAEARPRHRPLLGRKRRGFSSAA